MGDAEKHLGELLRGILARIEESDLELSIAYDQGCQIVMMARDEERAHRCPGCGSKVCLRIRGADE